MLSSPAGLLHAREVVVPFQGRTQLLEQMRVWAGQQGFGAWLVHGPGGQGKTRLAIQLAEELPENWVTLWLDPDGPASSLPHLAATARPLLVVIDYSEARTTQVVDLLQAVARHGRVATIKLLMLARTADDWWKGLLAGSRTAETMLDSAHVTELGPLAPDAESQGETYRTAVDTFARALGHLPAWRHHDWQLLASRLPAHPRNDFGPGVALTLHMTALADLLELAEPSLVSEPDPGGGDGTDAEERFLRHERRYWASTAKAAGLHPALSMKTLTDALATAFLAGSVESRDADALLRLVAGLSDQPQDRRTQVRDWMASLYPGAGSGTWDVLQPDRLLEVFIGQKLSDAPELAERLVAGASPARVHHMLTFYARAAVHPVRGAGLRVNIGSLIVRHPPVMTQALQVATQVERPRAILEALTRAVRESDVSVHRLAELAGQLPESSQKLAPFAVEIAQRLVDMRRSEMELRRRNRKNQSKARSRLAQALSDLSHRLFDVGRWDEALESNSECLAVVRRSAPKHAWGVMPEMASILNNRSRFLRQLGKREEALAASRQAVDIQRRLENDDLGRQILAGMLNNLCIDLRLIGRRDEAVEAAREAVAIHRRLASKSRDAHLPGLAMSLNNLSVQLSELPASSDESLAAIRETVTIKRELAQLLPDAHLPDLAGALNNLSCEQGEHGLREESLAAIQEAVEIRRLLAADLPDAHSSDLAQSLQNLSVELSQAGFREEGLEAVGECVDILRAQMGAGVKGLGQHLATGLHNQAVGFLELERPSEALDAISECIAIRERLVAAYPGAHAEELQQSFAVLRNIELLLGRPGISDRTWRQRLRPPQPMRLTGLILRPESRKQQRRRLVRQVVFGVALTVIGVMVGIPMYVTIICAVAAASLAVLAMVTRRV
ncbi:tetratricopeptide repeat protein [Streptomyces sp. NPDC059215]|uniref:tetratricopeptide repeat protein n=1 Tax=Streptomyces sp. NPDC059215 TaxID=3346772 RepID=UPI0036BF9B23